MLILIWLSRNTKNSVNCNIYTGCIFLALYNDINNSHASSAYVLIFATMIIAVLDSFILLPLSNF